MASRDGALARALTHFDSDGFRDHLAELVAIPSTSQDLGHEADVQRYVADAIRPWLERMGFAVEIHPNPIRGFGPILFADRDRTDRQSYRMDMVTPCAASTINGERGCRLGR
jgi:acetylornithine deacetylase/succinyl-diaminopimelate desuccinylase-like protein